MTCMIVTADSSLSRILHSQARFELKPAHEFAREDTKVEVKEVYRGEIDDLVEREGALLIDVREAGDLDTAPALPGNRHVPLSRIAELAGDVGVERPLIFYCRSGVLSYRAAEIAATWIRKPVYYLSGGLLADA